MDSAYISPKRSQPSIPRSTWRTIGLHRLLALRDFEERGPASSQPRDAKRRKHSGLRPTVSPKCFQPSIQRGHLAASRAISALRPSRLQGAKKAPLCYDARDAGKSRTWAHAASGEFKTVRSQRDAWHRLSLLGISLIAISINKDQPLHIRERRKAPWE
jgi:hypothetical protein